MKRFLKTWMPSLVIALVCSLLIRTYVVEAMVVPTGSMIPTIQIKDRVVVEKLLPMTNLRHGDKIVFYPPVEEEAGKRYVKRLIGLPGDTIQIKEGVLYRNEERVEEPYIKEPMSYDFGPIQVPDKQYFFLGDNRNQSYDAHLWATPFVDEEDLIGKVILTLPTHLIFGNGEESR
ncbi:signal peptidase I [Paenibacillus albicereus]|uniref:signal peptidase I n=1 Tax=Paenibacillus albicereus TaxID=2726185 RepID=UPI00197D0242|nr:signal peptidase I [Paenibacillus albicereus]